MKRNKKKQFDPNLLSTTADFCINFSVFWFGLAIATPIFPGIDPSLKPAALTVDSLVGILTLYIGYFLRRKIK